MDKIFDAQFAGTGLAGLAAAVWTGDTMWTKTAGYRDLTTKTPFRSNDHVPIASITKSFLATAIVQLVDPGTLKLTDVLESFVPGIANGATSQPTSARRSRPSPTRSSRSCTPTSSSRTRAPAGR